MKFKFCYTSEDGAIDNEFIADLFIDPGEDAVTDGPADNWYPGAPLQYEINEIYLSPDLSHPISDENLLDILSKELEKNYDSIYKEYEKDGEKDFFDEDFS